MTATERQNTDYTFPLASCLTMYLSFLNMSILMPTVILCYSQEVSYQRQADAAPNLGLLAYKAVN